MNNQRGFSIVEMVVAAGISVALFGGSAIVFSGTVTSMQHVTQQSDVDALYLSRLQSTRHIYQLKEWFKIPVGSTLEQCLSGKGANCDTAFGTEAPMDYDPVLNALFSSVGRCGEVTDVNTAACPMRVVTRYQWLCGTTACTGLRVNVSVTAPAAGGTGARDLASRSGSFSIPAVAFASKNTLKMNCAGTGTLPLERFGLRDLSRTVAPRSPKTDACDNPAANYGTASNCQGTQQSDCGGGFTTLALYKAQTDCPAAGAMPTVGALVLGGSDGAYLGPPAPPFFGYVAPPPYVPPARGTRWWWRRRGRWRWSRRRRWGRRCPGRWRRRR